MEGERQQGWALPGAPPAVWPTAPAPGPEGRPRRRGRWLLGVGALLLAAAGGAGAVAFLDGDDGDGDGAYCAALGQQGRIDVPMVVFLHLTTTAGGATRLQRQLEARSDIDVVEYTGREEAFAEARELFADEPSARDLLRPEDIPTSLRFTVSDTTSARDVRRVLADERLVLQVETPMHSLRTVRELADLVLQGEVEGELGRFGHWIAPDVADEVRATAPDEVAGEVDLLREALATDDGVIETRHIDALRMIVADAETRCG